MQAWVETLCLLAQPKEEQQLKNKNNQNCQKIEQYQNSTTKDIKKKHSSRPLEGLRPAATCREAVAGRPATDCATQSSSTSKQSLKPLTENTCGGSGGSRRNSQPHRRSHWRDPQGPRMYTTPPTREAAPEGPSLIVGSRGSD